MRVLLPLFAAVACHRPLPTPTPVDRDDDDIPDSVDTCPIELSPSCLAGGDDDSCPDPPPTDIGPGQAWAKDVDEIAQDAAGLAPDISMYVEGEPASVRRVASALIARGVPSWRIIEEPRSPAEPGHAHVTCH